MSDYYYINKPIKYYRGTGDAQNLASSQMAVEPDGASGTSHLFYSVSLYGTSDSPNRIDIYNGTGTLSEPPIYSICTFGSYQTVQSNLRNPLFCGTGISVKLINAGTYTIGFS